MGPYSSYQIGRLTGHQCNLDIAEILAFESELSDDEADKIESYLAHKWGLDDQLASGHPYKDRVAIRSPRDLGVSTDLTGLVKGNTYYYRVKAENTEGTDWADSTASFVSESRIDLSSGDITFLHRSTGCLDRIRRIGGEWSIGNPVMDRFPIQHRAAQGGEILLQPN